MEVQSSWRRQVIGIGNAGHRVDVKLFLLLALLLGGLQPELQAFEHSAKGHTPGSGTHSSLASAHAMNAASESCSWPTYAHMPRKKSMSPSCRSQAYSLVFWSKSAAADQAIWPSKYAIMQHTCCTADCWSFLHSDLHRRFE